MPRHPSRNWLMMSVKLEEDVVRRFVRILLVVARYFDVQVPSGDATLEAAFKMILLGEQIDVIFEVDRQKMLARRAKRRRPKLLADGGRSRHPRKSCTRRQTTICAELEGRSQRRSIRLAERIRENK